MNKRLFTINLLTDKFTEFHIELYIAFVHFGKAFDFLKHDFIIKVRNPTNVCEIHNRNVIRIKGKNCDEHDGRLLQCEERSKSGRSTLFKVIVSH